MLKKYKILKEETCIEKKSIITLKKFHKELIYRIKKHKLITRLLFIILCLVGFGGIGTILFLMKII